MSTLTWETATEQLWAALNAELPINGPIASNTYQVRSRSSDRWHRVWTRGHVVNCSCELSALGNKPCPHGALAFFRACWDRATEAGR